MSNDLQLSPAELIPAAQYVRMSTEHQQYSTENQRDIIRDYAARRGYLIGKSADYRLSNCRQNASSVSLLT
jgi:DNA invertase Pin-like site-specific DNA recombinase